MNELTRRCLDLPKPQKIRMIQVLTESLEEREDDGSRFHELFTIAEGLVGAGILTQSREWHCVLGRRMIAYQMRQEGYSLMKIGKCMNRHHASVVHMVGMMEDIFRYPGVFKEEEEYWNKFITKVKDHEANRRTISVIEQI